MAPRALELLMPHEQVSVFCGHIHQEHHFQTGHIAHHPARSLVFPLPAPGAAEKPTPLPWGCRGTYRGLGWRGIEIEHGHKASLTEYSVGAQA